MLLVLVGCLVIATPDKNDKDVGNFYPIGFGYVPNLVYSVGGDKFKNAAASTTTAASVVDPKYVNLYGREDPCTTYRPKPRNFVWIACCRWEQQPDDDDSIKLNDQLFADLLLKLQMFNESMLLREGPRWTKILVTPMAKRRPGKKPPDWRKRPLPPIPTTKPNAADESEALLPLVCLPIVAPLVKF